MKIYNPQGSPLIYGDSKTIDAHGWAEGIQEDFQELIDNNLVIVKDSKLKPVEKPIEITTSVDQKNSEVEEMPVVSEPSVEEKQDTINKVKRRSVPTKE